MTRFASKLLTGVMALMPASSIGETVVQDVTVTALIEAACTVFNATLDFGKYDPERSGPLDTTTQIDLECPEGTHVSIQLNGGLNHDGTHRRMQGARGDFLQYNIYTALDRAKIWGDGSAIGEPVEMTFSDMNPYHSVFGRLFGRQQVLPDTYTDTVTITVEVNGGS